MRLEPLDRPAIPADAALRATDFDPPLRPEEEARARPAEVEGVERAGAADRPDVLLRELAAVLPGRRADEAGATARPFVLLAPARVGAGGRFATGDRFAAVFRAGALRAGEGLLRRAAEAAGLAGDAFRAGFAVRDEAAERAGAAGRRLELAPAFLLEAPALPPPARAEGALLPVFALETAFPDRREAPPPLAV